MSLGGLVASVPGLHWLNHARYMVLDRAYWAVSAPGQAEMVAQLQARRERPLALTIAYNVPEAVDFLAEAMARCAPDTPFLICDNSSEPEARAALSEIAKQRGVLYLSLPQAPFVRVRSARSHAAAANWVFHNIIRKVRPRTFAFLDHDLIPLAPVDFSALVAHQPAYGLYRPSARTDAWYLWPGFAVFDRAIAGKSLDFGPDRLLATDTGGRNWYALYRHMNRKEMAWPKVRTVRVPQPDGSYSEPKMLVNGWLHVGGASYRGGVTALSLMRQVYDADPEGLLASLVDVKPAEG
ncbi:hypothetical protein ACT6QH_05050 [Xanthobacter sp. TB0139]|uniref:hypothetical protein n=1 Tax=Xanthobacter sp. TB0139 TaxID=3459178 RepID=UPI0040394B06